MNPAAPATSPTASHRHRAERADAIIAAWARGGAPDAAAVLAADPDLAADRALALGLAYEEFCLREEAGELVSTDAFCGRFPFSASLRRLIGVHRFLDANPDALGPPTAPAWPAPGDSVGDFLVVRELGRGGFSRVYLAAEGSAGGRPVALKLSADAREEAATLGPLSHPNLVPLLSSRKVGGLYAVAMPFAGTATLEDLIAVAWPTARVAGARTCDVILGAALRGRLPDDPPAVTPPASPITPGMAYEDGVVALAAALAAALAHLHARGVTHQDLKPSNVLLCEGGHVCLLDFNLSAGPAGKREMGGTLPYMAPERLAAIGPCAVAPAAAPGADVFALGVVLYEMLTGKHPFGPMDEGCGRSPAAIAADLIARQRAGATATRAVNRRVGRRAARAVDRCLAFDPSERPTAAELAASLARPRRDGRKVGRGLVAAVGVAALALALNTGWVRTGPGLDDPFERGVSLYRDGRYTLAAVEFDHAARRTTDGRPRACAGYCLALAGLHREAELAAGEAIGIGYRTPAVYANRGYSRLRLGKLDEAIEDCDLAIRSDPELPPPRLTRAAARLNRHLTAHPTRRPPAVPVAAADDVRAGIAAEPRDEEAWMLAARVLVLSPGQEDAAATAVLEAVSRGKHPEQIRRNPHLRDVLSGHPTFERALSLDPVAPSGDDNAFLVSPIP